MTTKPTLQVMLEEKLAPQEKNKHIKDAKRNK